MGIKVNCIAGRGMSSRPEVALQLAQWLQLAGVAAERIVIWDRTDRELARTLATREYQGRTLSYDEQLESSVESLTNEQIVEAMKKNFDLEQISWVQAGDFAKAAGMAEGDKPAKEAAVR